MESDRIKLYDDRDPIEAVVLAWTNKGENPGHHERMRNNVRRDMPILARAIERLAYEYRHKDIPYHDPRTPEQIAAWEKYLEEK